jgi:isopenicillin N synthase-like dioxygenase
LLDMWQLRERQSGEWLDVEAGCRAGEAILFVGEALQFGSGGRYKAAWHRVRRSHASRLSTVFELRAHDAP